eukprot:Phypoly_transcript_25908.p1 GENE.Phypoly_transcript_25908~~Phypoly_transcript_25908.p1  ORF type:complete len:111 (+),score=17.73 Phypoly_transcript_25908:163-495(+)
MLQSQILSCNLQEVSSATCTSIPSHLNLTDHFSFFCSSTIFLNFVNIFLIKSKFCKHFFDKIRYVAITNSLMQFAGSFISHMHFNPLTSQIYHLTNKGTCVVYSPWKEIK